MRSPEFCALLLAGVVAVGAGCGAGTTAHRPPVPAPEAAHPAAWTKGVSVTRVVDLAGPRSDGSLVVAADGRLSLLTPAGAVQPFARGPAGYSSRAGEEPYIALTPAGSGPGTGCAFPADTTYALALDKPAGLVSVDAQGRARRFVTLTGSGLLDGIAFDSTGRFDHRLLVTRTSGSRTTVYAVDCRGRVKVITATAPKVEGGIAVAPAGFGRFAGQLIAPDENSGRIFAIGPGGRSRLVASSGLPAGGDVGVESAGFVPPAAAGRRRALLADRATPGNPHPGDDVVLSLDGAALRAAGVRSGDLLMATEGGAGTVAVHCAQTCRVRHVADGPAVAHAEGHVVFAPGS